MAEKTTGITKNAPFATSMSIPGRAQTNTDPKHEMTIGQKQLMSTSYYTGARPKETSGPKTVIKITQPWDQSLAKILCPSHNSPNSTETRGKNVDASRRVNTDPDVYNLGQYLETPTKDDTENQRPAYATGTVYKDTIQAHVQSVTDSTETRGKNVDASRRVNTDPDVYNLGQYLETPTKDDTENQRPAYATGTVYKDTIQAHVQSDSTETRGKNVDASRRVNTDPDVYNLGQYLETPTKDDTENQRPAYATGTVYKDTIQAHVQSEEEKAIDCRVTVTANYTCQESHPEKKVFTKSYITNLYSYMKWKYLLTSQTTLDTCNQRLSESHVLLKAQREPLLQITYIVDNSKQAIQIVDSVMKEILRFDDGIIVETIDNSCAPECVKRAKESTLARVNLFYVEAISDNKLCVAYLKRHEQKIKEHFPIFLQKQTEPTDIQAEKHIHMAEIWIKLFEKYDFIKRLEEDHQQTSILIDRTNNRCNIQIKGPSKDVDEIHKQILMLEKKLSYRQCHLQISDKMLLRQLDICDELEKMLADMDVVVSWVDEELMMYSLKKKDLEAAAERVKASLSETKASDKQVHCNYLVENKDQFLTINRFMEDVVDKFKVKLTIDHSERHGFILCGSEKNVIAAKAELDIIKRSVEVNVIVVPKNIMASTKHTGLVSLVSNKYNVHIEEMQTSSLSKKHSEGKLLGAERLPKGLDDKNELQVEWTFPLNHKLVLVRSPLADSDANILLYTVKSRPKEEQTFNRQTLNDKKLIEVGIVHWIDGKYDEVKKLEQIWRKVLKKLYENNDESAAIEIDPVESWSPELYIETVTSVLCQHLYSMTKKQMPFCVELVIEKEGTYWKVQRCIDSKMKQFKSDNHDLDRKTFKVEVIVGEIGSTTADVLVNTTSCDLNLQYGNVSNSILKAAGPPIQQECKKNYPNGIAMGELAITGGHRLPCKFVFHGTVDRYDSKDQVKCIESLRSFTYNCLIEASDRKVKTIAFSAIGIGTLQYPVDIVATEMFISTERFKHDIHNTTIETVYFVVHPTDNSAVKEFRRIRGNIAKSEQANPNVVLGGDDGHVRILGQKIDVDEAKYVLKNIIEELEKKSNQTINCREDSFRGTNENQLKDTNQKSFSTSRTNDRPPVERSFSWLKHARNMRAYQSGQLVITVYQANILDAPVQCIVNAANVDLQHAGDIAMAIAKAAGDNLRRESRDIIQNRKGSLKVGEVVSTSAGRLGFECVLHAVGPCWYDYKPITEESLQACEKDLFTAVYGCLKKADEMGLRSIAIPAISSDIFAVPKEICCGQYAEAILRFALNKSNLKQIHFVDKDINMIQTIQFTFQTMLTNGKPSPSDNRVFIESSNANTRQGAAQSSPKPIAVRIKELHQRRNMHAATSKHSGAGQDVENVKSSGLSLKALNERRPFVGRPRQSKDESQALRNVLQNSTNRTAVDNSKKKPIHDLAKESDSSKSIVTVDLPDPKTSSDCQGSIVTEARQRDINREIKELPNDDEGFPKLPAQNLFKKDHDNTLSQLEMKGIEKCMESVGILVGPRGTALATAFRVGKKYVMTNWHVVVGVIDPFTSGDEQYSRLKDVWINFNGSITDSPCRKPYLTDSVVYKDANLDVVVLEVHENYMSDIPVPLFLCRFDIERSNVTDVTFVGFGHPTQEEKRCDPKCKILFSPNIVADAKYYVASRRDEYNAILDGNGPINDDLGYKDATDKNRFICSCFLEKGGSGAPALTTKDPKSIQVVGILTSGTPDFLFSREMNRELQDFPKRFRFETAIKMSSIHSSMMRDNARLANQLFQAAGFHNQTVMKRVQCFEQ